MSTILSANLIAAEHICIDFSANSAPISVEYSYLHVRRTYGWFLWIWRYLDQNWGSLSLTSKHTYNIREIIVRLLLLKLLLLLLFPSSIAIFLYS